RGSRDVPARDALDVHALAALHEHRALRELLALAEGRREAADIRRHEVVRHDVRGLPEPEAGEPREDAALVRDRRRQNGVERRQPIARDDDEAIAAGLVHVADLAAPPEGRAGDVGLDDRAHSGSTPFSFSLHSAVTERATSGAMPR